MVSYLSYINLVKFKCVDFGIYLSENATLIFLNVINFEYLIFNAGATGE